MAPKKDNICPHCNQDMKKFIVDHWAMDSWSGREHLGAKEFDTKELADEFIETINSKNTAPSAPEYYEYAAKKNY